MPQAVERVRKYSERDVMMIENREMLSGLEHALLGSTPPVFGMQENPRIPQALLETPSDFARIRDLRRLQRWIPSNAAAIEIIDFNKISGVTRYAVLFELPDIDPNTCELEYCPIFYGLYDRESRRIITDEAELEMLTVRPSLANQYVLRKLASMINSHTSQD